MSAEITIEKREFENAAAQAVCNGLKKFREAGERFRRERKEEDDMGEAANLAAAMFHMSETVSAVRAMEDALFCDGEKVQLTSGRYDDLAVEILNRAAQDKTRLQENGEYSPMQIMLGGMIAQNIALKELRCVLFGAADKKDEIFRSARESIQKQTEKEVQDLERDMMKHRGSDGPVGQTVRANTEASQEQPQEGRTFLGHIRARFGF